MSVGARARPLRLIVHEPALPKYRVPFYRELASRPSIRLTLVYSDVPGVPNAAPDGFDAVHVATWRLPVLGRSIAWSPSQWRYASPAHADVMILGWNLNYASLIPALMRARA